MEPGEAFMMRLHWIGALLMIVACGGIGFGIAMYDKKEYSCLRQLQNATEFMLCELNCRLTPLPGLLRKTAAQCGGDLRTFFCILVEELESQVAPDVSCCVTIALDRCSNLSGKVRIVLQQMGNTMGQFDLEGQIKGLESAGQTCERYCKEMEVNRPQRLRSYPTLGLCIGAVLAILFM